MVEEPDHGPEPEDQLRFAIIIYTDEALRPCMHCCMLVIIIMANDL